MRADFTEAVLEVAALIPEGAALAYGDIAELLGSGGPRQVGSVMSHSGPDSGPDSGPEGRFRPLPWWRVIRASGHPPDDLASEALDHYLAEGTPLRGTPGHGSWRVDLDRARWQPDALAFDRIDELALGLSAAKLSAAKLSVPGDEVDA
ncbi:MGMT family protein [Paenarthrobacter sp. DKR-5]|uniref:MGMT family protein n=1 Tax=Paenarthrobacter sp. DKR-5 TaxID=2835535 RepID=UPI001BDDA52A|nr:MGMT family protein [Paenarthrobacter sp. DKR-5]MBT1002949.1 MGMT family protein [Paenarthrobacter sp. DKR-5]